MHTYTSAEIHSLIERFEAHCLPKTEWTHEAHLVVAAWYCRQSPIEEAMDRVREYIILHNESVGTPNTDTEGYHETITRFWLLVTSTFLSTLETSNIADTCNALILSDTGKSNYPLEFYSKNRLFSVEARHQWLEPDLKAI